jgi:hypothetical protein
MVPGEDSKGVGKLLLCNQTLSGFAERAPIKAPKISREPVEAFREPLSEQVRDGCVRRDDLASCLGSGEGACFF